MLAISNRSMTIRVACELQVVRGLCRKVREFLADAGLSADELNPWEQTLAEAVNNAILYAPPASKNLPVQTNITVSQTLVEVRISDHTAGFDFPQNAVLPEPDAESGRGLFMIQSLTDEAIYLRGRGENCLVLRKHRNLGSRLSESADDSRQELEETRHTLDLMTEELASSYESLAAIFQYSAELSTNVSSHDFTRRWLDQLLTIIGADWYLLRLLSPDGNHLCVAATSLPGWQEHVIPLASSPDAPCLEQRAIHQHRDVWFDDATPLHHADPLATVGQPASGFAHPIVVNGTPVGVLTVACGTGTRMAEAGNINIIHTFADFLGIQVRNARFAEEQVRTRLMSREMEIATNIQRSLLPERMPNLRGFGMAGHCRSARQVGGDYYDAIVTGEGQLLLVVADVMGKGLPAAIFAAIFRSLVRARLDLAAKPGEFLVWLNRNLGADVGRVDMFITAQLAFVDLNQRRLRVAGAGHPPLLLAGQDGSCEALESSGPPLGVLMQKEYGDTERILPHGAQVFLFTDGLSEARDPAGELLGVPRLIHWLQEQACRQQPVGQTQQNLLAMLEQFEQGTLSGDDQAFVLLAEEPVTSTNHAS
ncbi:MAG: SpoIIE family protein phosphatase [Verrucomicrobiota bacterium]